MDAKQPFHSKDLTPVSSIQFVRIILTVGACILVEMTEARADYQSARQAQDQAYGEYIEALGKLKAIDSTGISRLKAQYIDPANRSVAEAHETEMRAKYPFPPLPKENSDPAIRAKMKVWRENRLKRFFTWLKTYRLKKGIADLKPAPFKPLKPVPPVVNSPKNPEGPVVEGDFPKELDFSKIPAKTKTF